MTILGRVTILGFLAILDDHAGKTPFFYGIFIFILFLFYFYFIFIWISGRGAK